MSDTKSSSSSSSAGGMKPTIPFLGDLAQQYVFGQLRFVPNKPKHRATTSGESKDSSGSPTTQMTTWRADAMSVGGTEVVAGAGKLGPMLGALYHSMSKLPTSGNCGEMALLAYRKIISLAIQYDVPMAVAAVSIGADWGSSGNHSFVLIGTDPGFTTVLAGEPKKLEVIIDRPPAGWGDNVFVCDPWIDDGACATFKATERNRKFESTWEQYLVRVQTQASDAVIKRAFNTAGGKLTLIVDDSLVVSNSSAALVHTVKLPVPDKKAT